MRVIYTKSGYLNAGRITSQPGVVGSNPTRVKWKVIFMTITQPSMEKLIMDRSEQDLVITPGQFCYLLDMTKGNVDVLIGPTKTSLSATDCPVRWNNKTRDFEVCSQTEAKRAFITVSEGDYVVLENPAVGGNSYPTKGTRSTTVELLTGYKVNIPGPCSFALYPGQSSIVIPGHHLRSNQYLLARVYNDKAATASWNQAIVRRADGEETELTETPPELHMGQLMIIKGTEVSFYIPPTGMEVVKEADNYIRNAETLELLEFCILLNETGDKRYCVGPDVVFPKPTETFVQQGNSRKGRAIELNTISGLYVKVIASYEDDTGNHQAGDELFITGKETAIYYPRPEHSLIKYGDRTIHYAVAIPEGEGRYVLNRTTGVVRIETGPSMFLPDPRTEVVVRQILSESETALLYPGNNEAMQHNKMMAQSSQINADDVPMEAMALSEDIGEMFQERGVIRGRIREMSDTTDNVAYAASSTTGMSAAEDLLGGTEVTQRKLHHLPTRTITLNTKYDGVVTVDVWTGYATLIVRKNGERRVVVGPQTVLLEYDEKAMPIKLSTGTPKTDERSKKSGYLRVLNNRVSDQITVETSDLWEITLKVRYHVNFIGEPPEKWFNVENYIQFLAERMRSLIRREAKRHTVREFHANAVDVVRNLILGLAKKGQKRSGRLFEENNMHVFDIDVLSVEIDDRDVSYLLIGAEQEALHQELELRSSERKLIHTQRLEEIKRDIQTSKTATTTVIAALEVEEVNADKEISLARVRADTSKQKTVVIGELERQSTIDAIAEAGLSRKRAADDQLTDNLEREAGIRATELKERAAAFSPDLIVALQNMSEKELAERLAKSLGPLAIMGGESVVDIAKQLFAGTPVESAIAGIATSLIGSRLVGASSNSE